MRQDRCRGTYDRREHTQRRSPNAPSVLCSSRQMMQDRVWEKHARRKVRSGSSGSTSRFYAPCRASGFVDRRTTACAMFLLTSERMARAEDMVVADEEDVCGSKAGRPADSIGRRS